MIEALDAKNTQIRAELQAALDAEQRLRCGDFIIFADGVTRRISHIWIDVTGTTAEDVQTSDGGSFHIGHGYVSFSGTLYRSVPASTLTRTDGIREGWCWFWRDGWPGAHRGIDTLLKFRVYTCSQEATR